MRNWKLCLTLFGDGDGAAAAPGSESAQTLSAVVNTPQAGDTLQDGTKVDSRLAERMEKQRKRHPERQMQIATAQNKTDAQQPGNQIEDEWTQAKKGRFAEQYGRDVQAAVAERFKNQQDNAQLYQEAQSQLDGMKPMLDALMKQTGAKSIDELKNAILDDDSLYEEDAEKMGMTVQAYKSFKKLQEANEAMRAQEEQNQQQLMLRNHLEELARQGDTLKATFPDFDLQRELENPVFFRLTAPNSGLTVEQAYYAVHHAELAPQAMAAGIRKAQTQISQSLQANGKRPVEGAMQSTAPADITMDPRKMTREQREEIKRQVRMGKKIVF